MNKLLTLKNEWEFKKNSCDFYTMTILSKEILGLDKYRIKNYIKFLDHGNRKNLRENNITVYKRYQNYLYNSKFKIIIFIGFSICMIKKFKSILIVPVFFISYKLTKTLWTQLLITKKDYNCLCYFCEKNKEQQLRLLRFDKYFKLVDNIFEKNPNIKNWMEFENELGKYIKNK